MNTGISLSNNALAALMADTLGKNAQFRFRAQGSSMRPWIRSGDILTISPLSKKGPKLGDVVAFSAVENSLIVHRVVGIKEQKYLVAADNATSYDGFFPVNVILGRVAGIERRGKKICVGLGPERVLIALLTRFRVRLRNHNPEF